MPVAHNQYRKARLQREISYLGKQEPSACDALDIRRNWKKNRNTKVKE